MGFDVYGKKNDEPVGEYFRNNVWWWHDLWCYCEEVAPKLTAKVKHAHTNDGDGLGARDSKALAKILRKRIEEGHATAYEKAFREKQASIPDEQCGHCNGTGKRNDMHVKDGCNGCKGKGTTRPLATWYVFEVSNVETFAAFLEHCGGFTIC